MSSVTLPFTGEARSSGSAIVQRFSGDFAPARLSLAYRVALAATAATMVLLPLMYLALAAGAAWGVWWWLGAGLAIFRHNTSLWSLLLYLTPAVAGGITVMFLFKPFFAPREKPAEPIEVDLDREPMLRDFLEEICRRVGVARPASVQLNATVNASASFRRGWMSLGQRDLTLTLGTPLIAGLTAQQLGGVIAHEFGHFAQRTGMSSHYVIRTVNDWFAHVVFGRDRWDAWLVENSENNDWRIAAPLWCARGGVWLSRRILHGLLYVAHALSCWLSRQMEFDADYYAAQLQGAESFAATAHAVSALSVAEARAIEDINTWWRDHRVVADFAQLVRQRRTALPAELETALAKAHEEEKTLWHHTHPCMRDRVARVRLTAPAGVLNLDAPASDLFQDFAASSREVTVAFYQRSVGERLREATPLTDDEVAQRIAGDEARTAALQRLTHGAIGLDRPVLLTLAEIAPGAIGPHPAGTEHAAWFKQNAGRLRIAIAADTQAYNRLQELAGARRFVEGGLALKPASFRLNASSVAAVDEARTEALKARLEHDALLTGTVTRVRERLRTFARLAHAQPDSPAAVRLRALLETFASLSPFYSHLPRLLQLQSVAQLFAANESALASNTQFVLVSAAVGDEVRRAVEAWLPTASGVPDAFADPSTNRSVADLVRTAGNATTGHATFTAQLSAAIRYYFQLLAECATLVESLEAPVTAP